jgi:hypothetical protein
MHLAPPYSAVALEPSAMSGKGERSISIFLDFWEDSGQTRAIPIPYVVSEVEVVTRETQPTD